MRFLLIVDAVEAPFAVNPQLGRRLAGALAEQGHSVHLLELWDAQTPPPAPPPGVTLHDLPFADERLMNAALENGAKSGSPLPLRLARLAAHPSAVTAAFRQFVFKKPRRTTATQREIQRLDAALHFDCIAAVCAPYRAAFALEGAATAAKKVLWQLDPYAANLDYRAPGGFAREGRLLDSLYASFVTPQAMPDYADGAPLAAWRGKIHSLGFPALRPGHTAPRQARQCVFCGTLYPGLRSPDFALALFGAVPDWTLVMAGNGWQHFAAQSGRARAAMGQRLVLPGLVPPKQARALQGGADVLLSLGNMVDNQLPSKLFEYLGSGKPILHLAVSDNDPALPYLRRYPLALVLRQADAAAPQTQTTLQSWLAQVSGKTLPFEAVAALYPDHTPQAVATAFLAALQPTTNNEVLP